MKHLFSILTAVFAVLVFLVSCGGSEESSEPGSIYGIVTDKVTGEPVKNAGVELLPVGLKTVTGSDGSFEFLDIAAGHYNLLVTKTGYKDTKSSTITVESGKQTHVDIHLEIIPVALRIVDDDGNDISELDFGVKQDDVSRSFNILNDGAEKFEWEISCSADWIASVSKESGTLKAGARLGIIVKIDRTLLREGENLAQLFINSDNGNKQLTVKAENYDVVTLDATKIAITSAMLNGELINNDAGYTEIGFVYGKMATPSFDNNAASVSNSTVQLGAFGNAVSDLAESQTYYYRAYAKNATKTVYGETKSFATPRNEDYAILPGGLIVAKKDAGKVDWDDAIDMCENYTLAGLTDWHLPTKDELITVYNNKNSVGNFQEDLYWSSTPSIDGQAVCVDFKDGSVCYIYKYSEKYVRCVRYDKRTTDCKGLPENAEWNAVSSIEQTYDGIEWKPSENGLYNKEPSDTECRFKCVSGYAWDGNACVNPCESEPCVGRNHATGQCSASDKYFYFCECEDNYLWSGEECLNPCDGDPNPCVGKTHSTEVCTPVDATTYSCGCDDGFTWNNSSCDIWCNTLNITPCKDPETNLIWSTKSASPLAWDKAASNCSDLDEGGFNNWRLPSIDELRSLIDGCSNTKLDGECKVSATNGCLSSTSECYSDFCKSCGQTNSSLISKFGDSEIFWSISVSSSHNHVWGVNFNSGAVVPLDTYNPGGQFVEPYYYKHSIRCVR